MTEQLSTELSTILSSSRQPRIPPSLKHFIGSSCKPTQNQQIRWLAICKLHRSQFTRGCWIRVVENGPESGLRSAEPASLLVTANSSFILQAESLLMPGGLPWKAVPVSLPNLILSSLQDPSKFYFLLEGPAAHASKHLARKSLI